MTINTCLIVFYQDCSHCQKEPFKELKETVQELETLSSIICGGTSNPSLKKLSSLRRLDLLRCESEELLSKSTMGNILLHDFLVILVFFKIDF